MVSPEAIGRGLDLEYRNSGFSQGLLNFENNKTDNALDMTSAKDREFNLSLGVSPTVDLFFKVPQQSVSLVGFKAQLIGEPSIARSLGNKLSFSLAMGNNQDSLEGSTDVSLKSNAQEIALIHGYRFSPNLMIYESITYSQYNFSGKIENASASFEDDEFDYSANSIIGIQAGLELGWHSFKMKLEYATQRIEWTNTEAKLYQSFGYSLTATF